MRLVHHRDDSTSTVNSLVSGDLLYFESLKRSRNVVLRNVVRGGFLGQVVQHVLTQSRWQILRHVALVVGVGTGLPTLHQNAPASIHAGHVGGLNQVEEFVAQRGPVRGVSGGAGANYEDLVGVRPEKRELDFEDLGIRVCLRAVVIGRSRVVHPNLTIKHECGDRARCVGEG